MNTVTSPAPSTSQSNSSPLGDGILGGAGAATTGTPPFFPDGISPDLKAMPYWVTWAYQPRKDGTVAKNPINPRTGKSAKSNDPATWGTFEAAAAAYGRGGMSGVGLMFPASRAFTGIDLDDCIENGHLHPRAQDLVNHFASYTEVSPSGTGVKIWIFATKPPGAGCQKRDVCGCSQIEAYDHGRYFCATGRHLPGTPMGVQHRQQELDRFCKALWPAQAEVAPNPVLVQASPTTALQSTSDVAVAMAAAATLNNEVVYNRCRKYLIKMKPAIEGKGGDAATFAACAVTYEFMGDDDQNAWGLMAEWNLYKCVPPWTTEELLRKLVDAKAKVAKSPNGLGWRGRKAGCIVTHHKDLPAWMRKATKLVTVRLSPFH